MQSRSGDPGRLEPPNVLFASDLIIAFDIGGEAELFKREPYPTLNMTKVKFADPNPLIVKPNICKDRKGPDACMITFDSGAPSDIIPPWAD